MNLKNLFAASALSAALLVAGTAHAAGPTSGQIIIRGTVGALCEIGVVDYGTNLDLVAGEANRAVGQVKETCNDPDGYSVSFTSAEGGKMVGPRGAVSAYAEGMPDPEKTRMRAWRVSVEVFWRGLLQTRSVRLETVRLAPFEPPAMHR